MAPGTQSVSEWYGASARRSKMRFALGLALILTGFFVFLFGTLAAAITKVIHPVFAAMLGFILLTVGGVVIAFSDAKGPPAAVRVAGALSEGGQRIIELACPNCGAAVRRVHASGVAVCEYCKSPLVVG